MSILTPRHTFTPFEYPECYNIWGQQQSAHWLPTEVQMSGDLQNWNVDLSETEKHVIGSILKGFVMTEVFIEEYWSQKVSKFFPKPEIGLMCSAFSSSESVHIVSYDFLQTSLGIQDHEAFLKEPVVANKLNRLMTCKDKTKEEIAMSLAIFSAFNEGVSLFSNFAILLSFQRRGLLKNVAKIIEWSAKDEVLHSSSGCMLYNTLVREFPEILTDEFKKEIYEAARLTVQLEDDCIDSAFEKGPIEGIDPKDLKNYIRYRTNTKLNEIGFKSNWKNINREALERLEWFNVLIGGLSVQDFFAGKETNYSKGMVNFEDVWS